MITVATALLAAIAKWAYADHSKPLGMVLFGDGRIVATDAHRLVIVPCPEATVRFGVWRDHILAAVAAQDSLARADVEPQIGHDMDETDYSMMLAYGPRGDRTIDIAVVEQHAVMDIGGVEIRAPLAPESRYTATANVDGVFTGAAADGNPDGYLLDARFMAAIVEVNDATAGFREGVRVTRWSALRADGTRGPVCLEGGTGVRFAIMPRLDRAAP